MIQKLEMTVLIDNVAGEPLAGEWGLSILIIADGRKILLDTGSSDLFARNADCLGIDLGSVDTIPWQACGAWSSTRARTKLTCSSVTPATWTITIISVLYESGTAADGASPITTGLIREPASIFPSFL